MSEITAFLKNLPPEVAVVVAASLPVLELRGAIPLGVLYYDLPVWKVFLLAVVGNLIPVPFLLLLLRPVSRLAHRWGPTKRFFVWLYERARKKGVSVERLEALGVFLFVAVPVPGTGAWMGSVVAEVFGLPFRTAFVSILLGVITAGVVVSFVSRMGLWAVAAFFAALFVSSYLFARR